MKEPLTITEEALKMIREIMTEKNVGEEYKLRVGINSGSGCSGVNYLIGFDKKKDEDLSYQISGIEILLEKKHLMFLLGITLDYISDGEVGGFAFLKPDEK
ncbi:MAG: iron-sulfur cluster assembly accessory protein [Cyclobacteriaceae bacterium]|nr:iron-sulfur cluster assembly accessory protein [Cyclobacteriaceae bacterium]